MSKVNQNIIAEIEAEQMKSDVPAFAPGDTVVVKVKVTKARSHVFRHMKVWLLQYVTVAYIQHLPFVKSRMVLVLSVYSKLTAQ